MADEKPHLHVEFFLDTKLDKRASAEAGRPIHKEIEKVRIKWAGDRNQSLVAPAHSGGSIRDPMTNDRMTYAEQFPEHYKAFKAQERFIGDGTPLEELPFITAAKRADLKAANIHTAEALVSLDGSMLQKLGMGARELKNQAQAWLDKAAGSALETKLAAQNTALQDQIEALKAQMATLVDAKPAPDSEPEESGEVSTSPFESWDDEAIKAWIKDATGQAPRGVPAHSTLVAKADEINAQLADQAA